MTSIEEVFEELNFPSAARLKRALTARGIPFDANEVDSLVRGEAVRQVQAPRYTFNGKIAATDLNSRWCVDLIDFTLSPSNDGEKYILFAQDVFSRYIYTEAGLDCAFQDDGLQVFGFRRLCGAIAAYHSSH